MYSHYSFVLTVSRAVFLFLYPSNKSEHVKKKISVKLRLRNTKFKRIYPIKPQACSQQPNSQLQPEAANDK